MATIPVEIVKIGNIVSSDVTGALRLANASQREFCFLELGETEASILGMHAYSRTLTLDLYNILNAFRSQIRGYHPFLIAIVDSHLDGERYTNLFGEFWPNEGLAVVTTANVIDVIMPKDRIVAYFIGSSCVSGGWRD
jgi:hypothetical protein